MPPVEEASAGGFWGALPCSLPFPGFPSSSPMSIQRDFDSAKQMPAPASPADMPSSRNFAARQVPTETP